MIHQIKIESQYFRRVESGEKTFEIRDNRDRDFQVGDTVIMREWAMIDDKYQETGEEVAVNITYITSYGQPEGQVVFAFEKL